MLSLGEVAVDGFFLISGYLLTSSLLSNPSLRRYFVHRITRIYPGFLVAFFFCVFVVAPVAGGPSVMPDLLRNVIRAVLLQPPQVTGAFAGARVPYLDGAMWTISYEFYCYIGLAILFVSGLLKRPWILFLAAGGLLVVVSLRLKVDITHHTLLTGGAPQSTVRLAAAFSCGSTIKRFINPRTLHFFVPIGCFIIVLISLGHRWLAEPVLIVFGGLALIWVAERRFSDVVSAIGVRRDLSYGVYLYAWPVQNVLIPAA